MVVATEYRPAEISRAFLGHSHWGTPETILDAVFRPHSRVAVKACHASSKTFTASDAVVLSLLAGGQVITTAPTWEQVRTVLWGEVHRALYDLQRRFGLVGWDINQTEVKTPNGGLAIGLSTNEGVRFQGFHARPDSFLLIVMDEAPGVLPSIYEAIAGISAGGDVRQLLLGNPVIASGPFYDIFAGDVPGWERFTIDAFSTPNLQGLSLDALLGLDEAGLDLSERPYLVTRRWVRDRYHEWGEDHPLWESRVRGRFPLQADDALLSLSWLEQAGLRKVDADARGVRVAGIDVAGPGEDETVLCVRQGGALVDSGFWSSADSRGDVLAALRPHIQRGLATVNVDSNGMGYYFAQHLRDNLPPEIEVREVNVGESPTTESAKEKYLNLKAELYWAFRERAQEGDLAGLTDRATIAQLAGIRYKHDAKGRVVIESKEDARKRGVRSPDRAEAVVLAFAPADPNAERMRAFMAVAGRRAGR